MKLNRAENSKVLDLMSDGANYNSKKSSNIKKKSKAKSLRDNSWVQGYFAAIANMDAGHDIGSMAEEAIEEMGIYTVADFRRYGVADFDINILKKHLPFVRDRRDKKARSIK